MRKLECPGCGASLELKEDNRDFAFCEYCGAKIMLDDYRSSQHITKHIIDEAQLRRIEAEQENMEFQARQSQRSDILKQWDAEQAEAERNIEQAKSNLHLCLWLCLVGIGIYALPFVYVKYNNLQKDYQTKKSHRDYLRTLSTDEFFQQLKADRKAEMTNSNTL